MSLKYKEPIPTVSMSKVIGEFKKIFSDELRYTVGTDIVNFKDSYLCKLFKKRINIYFNKHEEVKFSSFKNDDEYNSYVIKHQDYILVESSEEVKKQIKEIIGIEIKEFLISSVVIIPFENGLKKFFEDELDIKLNFYYLFFIKKFKFIHNNEEYVIENMLEPIEGKNSGQPQLLSLKTYVKYQDEFYKTGSKYPTYSNLEYLKNNIINHDFDKITNLNVKNIEAEKFEFYDFLKEKSALNKSKYFTEFNTLELYSGSSVDLKSSSQIDSFYNFFYKNNFEKIEQDEFLNKKRKYGLEENIRKFEIKRKERIVFSLGSEEINNAFKSLRKKIINSSSYEYAVASLIYNFQKIDKNQFEIKINKELKQINNVEFFALLEDFITISHSKSDKNYSKLKSKDMVTGVKSIYIKSDEYKIRLDLIINRKDSENVEVYQTVALNFNEEFKYYKSIYGKFKSSTLIHSENEKFKENKIFKNYFELKYFFNRYNDFNYWNREKINNSQVPLFGCFFDTKNYHYKDFNPENYEYLIKNINNPNFNLVSKISNISIDSEVLEEISRDEWNELVNDENNYSEVSYNKEDLIKTWTDYPFGN